MTIRNLKATVIVRRETKKIGSLKKVLKNDTNIKHPHKKLYNPENLSKKGTVTIATAPLNQTIAFYAHHRRALEHPLLSKSKISEHKR